MTRETLSDLAGVVAISVTAIFLFSLPAIVHPVLMA